MVNPPEVDVGDGLVTNTSDPPDGTSLIDVKTANSSDGCTQRGTDSTKRVTQRLMAT